MKNHFQRRVVTCCIVVLTFSTLLLTGPALADKSSVRIDAPDQVAAGSTITIVLQVTHRGNNFIHHTDWLTVAINEEEAQRWAFGSFSKPESENFTRELTYTVNEPIEIRAEANCNLHGGTGAVTHTVSLAPEPSGETTEPAGPQE